MGSERTWFVLCKAADVPSDEVITRGIGDTRGKVELEGAGTWTVTSSRKSFDVNLSRQAHVVEESSEMAEVAPEDFADRVRAADVRFEILFDAMDLTSYWDVLEQVAVRLAALTDGVVYDPHDDRFHDAITTKKTTLADGQVAAVRAFLPARFDDMRDDLTIEDVVQPFFSSWTILDVTAIAEDLAASQRAHVACSNDTQLVMLTGAPENLSVLARDEPTTMLSCENAALLYALNADFWTSERLPKRVLRSVDDLTFRSYDDDDREQEANVRREHGGAISPATATRTAAGGWCVVLWIVDDVSLVRRELRLTDAGDFERDDEVVVEELPIERGPAGGFDVF